MSARTLLIVDDSEDHRFITATEVRRIKAAPPFQIVEAAGASEALERLEQLTRHNGEVLVLCDYRMPRVGGLELLRLVRDRYGSAHIRFVVYSSTDQGVAEEAAQAGADEFMVKPMDLQQFRAALKRLVDEWYASKLPAKPLRRPI